MSDPPKKRKAARPNAAAQALASTGPTGTKNDIRYFEERYESCMRAADAEQENKAGVRAWKARALEAALYLSIIYAILDGEKKSMWEARVQKLTATVHRTPASKITSQ